MDKTREELIENVADFIVDTVMGETSNTSSRRAGVIAYNALASYLKENDFEYEAALQFMLSQQQCPHVWPDQHEKTDFERGASCTVCGYLPNPTPSQIKQMRDEDMADMSGRD